MHMPPQPQASVPPGASTMPSASAPPMPSGAPRASTPNQLAASPASGYPSMPPVPSVPPGPQLPPISRSMEATAMVPRGGGGNKTGLMVGLFAAIIAVVGAAVFLLMPRSGTLVVNVADSNGAAVENLEVLVDGAKRCESAPCIVRDVPAGVHEVKVAAKGYELAAPRAITVDKKDVTMDFKLVAAKASAGTGFKVSSKGTGVKLQVDGKDVGPLPQELRDLEPGEHKLRFVGDRYAPLEKTVNVAKDEIVDLGSVELKVIKGKATIQLGTPGAKVYLVDGSSRKEVPHFPMAIEFDPNQSWELQATKDGFQDYRERIRFEDGQAEKTIDVTLTPKGAAPAAPVAAQPAAPAPKAASPAVKAPDAPKEPKKEPAAAGGEAVLKINSLPASSIVLDGKPIGATPQLRVVVSPGSHTVMFVNAEQSLKKTITVDVKAGETKAAFAKLRE
jgi:serine/threonine-protein kinase